MTHTFVNMIKYYLSALFLFLSVYINAQQATLTGNVIDALKKEGIEFASISLKSKTDTSIILGAKSKESGTFSVEKIPYGTYTITICPSGLNQTC